MNHTVYGSGIWGENSREVRNAREKEKCNKGRKNKIEKEKEKSELRVSGSGKAPGNSASCQTANSLL